MTIVLPPTPKRRSGSGFGMPGEAQPRPHRRRRGHRRRRRSPYGYRRHGDHPVHRRVRRLLPGPGADHPRTARIRLGRARCGRAGACGLPLKNARPLELLAQIGAVGCGDAVVAPCTPRRLLETVTAQITSTEPAPARTASDRPDRRGREALADTAAPAHQRTPHGTGLPGPPTAPPPRVDAPSYRGTARHCRIRSRGANDMRVSPPSLTAGSHTPRPRRDPGKPPLPSRPCRSRSGHRRPSPTVACAAVLAQQLVIRDDDRRNPWDRMDAQVWPGS